MFYSNQYRNILQTLWQSIEFDDLTSIHL